MNIQAHEQIQVYTVIDPDVLTAATHTGFWMPARAFHRFLAVFSVGTLGSSATVDCAVLQATNAGGAGSKDLIAATQLTQAGTDESDSQIVLSFRPEDLDTENGYAYINLEMVVGTASSDGGAVLLGIDPVYGYDATKDASSVVEVTAA